MNLVGASPSRLQSPRIPRARPRPCRRRCPSPRASTAFEIRTRSTTPSGSGARRPVLAFARRGQRDRLHARMIARAGFVLGVRLASRLPRVVVGVATDLVSRGEVQRVGASETVVSRAGCSHRTRTLFDRTTRWMVFPGVRSPKSRRRAEGRVRRWRSPPPRGTRARLHFPAAARAASSTGRAVIASRTIRASATVGRRRDRRLGRRRRRCR